MMTQRPDADGGAPAGTVTGTAEPRLLQYLQEANEKLLLASLQAQELGEKAEQARGDAEAAAAALKETERELSARAELREHLLGMVGHDLTNPLWSIRLSAQQMKEHGSLTEEDAQDVARILRTVGRMERMIRQLLDFTRARLGGGFKMARAPADLGALCHQAAEELALRSQDPIRCESQGDVTGSWDADRLMEVLSNILGNAISYATPGAPILVQVRDEGAEVVAEISNQGKPIPAELLPFIFDAFRQARQGQRTARSSNLGLGLYIANQIMLAHGGALAARSADGTTTFTIRLPRLPP